MVESQHLLRVRLILLFIFKPLNGSCHATFSAARLTQTAVSVSVEEKKGEKDGKDKISRLLQNTVKKQALR